ncbi:MAG: hypothetical protein FWD17_08570 [Polyangiaceae bacterium]|nr:hypothetical protein [Polyangiaceae bacterium]
MSVLVATAVSVLVATSLVRNADDADADADADDRVVVAMTLVASTVEAPVATRSAGGEAQSSAVRAPHPNAARVKATAGSEGVRTMA